MGYIALLLHVLISTSVKLMLLFAEPSSCFGLCSLIQNTKLPTPEFFVFLSHTWKHL